MQKLLRKARKGTRVIYVSGNHDTFVRDFADYTFGEVVIVAEAIHELADGRRLLVLHGDQFDGIVNHAQWLAYLGDHAYTVALKLNRWLNAARQTLGFPYWSLSAYLKNKVKNAVRFIANFEEAVAGAARRHGVDGVVCGHIHHPEMREIDGLLYCNDGDWVESCTALAEHFDGTLEIIRGTSFHAPAPPAPFFQSDRNTACESSLSPTPGTRKSTAWFARSKL